MAEKKINNKEIVLRQWFAAKYGNSFGDGPTPNWALPKGIAEMNREYTRDNPNIPISFNFFMYKVREMEIEVRTAGKFELFDNIFVTEYLDGTERSLDSNSAEFVSATTPIQRVVAAPVKIELNVNKMDDMTFPKFRDFPTGTVFDRICSDADNLKGPMSGMVIICTGESGVGKSTLLIDMLAKMKAYDVNRKKESRLDQYGKIDRSEVKPLDALYISTEMTKTDLYFFHQKMPAIGSVKTLLIAEYLKQGLKEAVTMAFQSAEYDVIVLDSYQDLVEKMMDILNWRAKEAENFLIQLMIGAAEDLGKCIIAIQHLTKGGEYVGRTFLKHTTTAMLQLKFDKGGQRFAVFTKNRRGGSMTHIPIYFTVKDKEVQFDEEAFETMVQSNQISASVTARAEKLTKNFGDMFGMAKAAVEELKDGEDRDNTTFNIADEE